MLFSDFFWIFWKSDQPDGQSWHIMARTGTITASIAARCSSIWFASTRCASVPPSICLAYRPGEIFATSLQDASNLSHFMTFHDLVVSCVDVRWTWQTKASLRHFSTLKTNSHRDISQIHKAHIEIHRNYSSKAMAEYGSYDWIWSVDQWPGIPSRRETRCTGSCSSTTGHNSEGATAQIERFLKEVNCTWTVLLWDIVTCSHTQL